MIAIFDADDHVIHDVHRSLLRCLNGWDDWVRTGDLSIIGRMLFHLSYSPINSVALYPTELHAPNPACFIRAARGRIRTDDLHLDQNHLSLTRKLKGLFC